MGKASIVSESCDTPTAVNQQINTARVPSEVGLQAPPIVHSYNLIQSFVCFLILTQYTLLTMFTFAALVVAATATLATAQSQVTIDLSTKYQTIDGFGFSEAFGFGEGIVNAPEEQQNQALTYLFNTTSGAGLTILRNEISADKGTTIAPNSPGSPEKALAFTWDGKDAGQVCALEMDNSSNGREKLMRS